LAGLYLLVGALTTVLVTSQQRRHHSFIPRLRLLGSQRILEYFSTAALAFKESLGFLTGIPDESWQSVGYLDICMHNTNYPMRISAYVMIHTVYIVLL